MLGTVQIFVTQDESFHFLNQMVQEDIMQSDPVVIAHRLDIRVRTKMLPLFHSKIREQLGLKPLPIEKISTPKSAPTSSTRSRVSVLV